jgi:nicotinate-nucleotide adenylyltransferase
LSESAGEQSRTRTGVLGGTFDPIHQGHLAVAAHACSALSLDRIVFIPAARPPHKPEFAISPFAHRVAMLELALKGHPQFVLSSMEEKREGPSYSIDTLQELGISFGKKEKLFFLIGMDAFVEINTWKKFREIPRVCDIVVIDRSEYSLELMARLTGFFGSYVFSPQENCWICPDLPGRIHSLSMKPVDISSTAVRRLVSQGKSLHGLVDEEVADYIRVQGLYRK